MLTIHLNRQFFRVIWTINQNCIPTYFPRFIYFFRLIVTKLICVFYENFAGHNDTVLIVYTCTPQKFYWLMDFGYLTLLHDTHSLFVDCEHMLICKEKKLFTYAITVFIVFNIASWSQRLDSEIILLKFQNLTRFIWWAKFKHWDENQIIIWLL